MKNKISYFGFLLIGTLSLISLTSLHDPVIHGLMSYINGWNVMNFETGILTGYTNISVYEEQFYSTPIVNVWLFFMAPSLVLFFVPFLIILYNPQRHIALIGVILMFLNFGSLSPESLLGSSDASQAMKYLIEVGYNPIAAMIFHWSIFSFAIIALMTVFYVMFENNEKDAKERVKVITGK